MNIVRKLWAIVLPSMSVYAVVDDKVFDYNPYTPGKGSGRCFSLGVSKSTGPVQYGAYLLLLYGVWEEWKMTTGELLFVFI